MDDATPSNAIDSHTAAAGAARAKTELARARDIRLGSGQAVLAGLFIGWAAIALKAGLNEALQGDTGYILLMAATVLAAWFGGLVGGLTATITAVTLNAVVVIDANSDVTPRVELARQVLYVVVATGTVLLLASRRAVRDRLADALDEVATLAEEVEGRDARLELMLSASGTGFWEWDVATGELTWSEAIFRQHGLAPTDRAPDFPTYLTMIHPDDRERFEAALRATMGGTAPFSLEFRIVWADGSVHWTYGAARVFRDADGRALRMIGTGQDITVRRRLEDQRDELLADERRAAEFREAFIDVISHELRTPITTILGITQLLTRPGRVDDPATRTAMLDDVRSESERLHRLVEDLLVLSRVERAGLIIEAEPLEVRRLLERTVAHEAAELPSIDIALSVGADLPIVAGEGTYVDQIVRNLLNNAAKYTPVGTHVTVSAIREGDEVALRVSDDGPGVPEESVERVFELFYRDPDSARTVAGSGIGLFVCASLVEAMGGRIWVRRPAEGGSEFGFTLPVLPSDEDLGEEPGVDDAVDDDSEVSAVDDEASEVAAARP